MSCFETIKLNIFSKTQLQEENDKKIKKIKKADSVIAAEKRRKLEKTANKRAKMSKFIIH